MKIDFSRGRMTDIDNIELAPDLEPLSATRYPLWVVLFGMVVFAAFAYSLALLPQQIKLARELATANQLDAKGNYFEAERHYSAVLANIPGSESARIGMAHSLFADANPDNDPMGLALIADLTLRNGDWDKLAPVMPKTYRDKFIVEKR